MPPVDYILAYSPVISPNTSQASLPSVYRAVCQMGTSMERGESIDPREHDDDGVLFDSMPVTSDSHELIKIDRYNQQESENSDSILEHGVVRAIVRYDDDLADLDAPGLICMLYSDVDTVRDLAFHRLVGMGPSAVDYILALLNDPRMVGLTAEMLGIIGDPQAISYLMNAVGTRNANEQVYDALCSLPLEPFHCGALLSYERLRSRMIDKLVSMGDAGRDELIRGVDSRDRRVVKACARGLGRLREHSDHILSILCGLLRSEFHDVVDAAALALGDIGYACDRVVSDLCVILRNRPHRSVYCICEALGMLKDTRPIPTLLTLLYNRCTESAECCNSQRSSRSAADDNQDIPHSRSADLDLASDCVSIWNALVSIGLVHLIEPNQWRIILYHRPDVAVHKLMAMGETKLMLDTMFSAPTLRHPKLSSLMLIQLDTLESKHDLLYPILIRLDEVCRQMERDSVIRCETGSHGNYLTLEAIRRATNRIRKSLDDVITLQKHEGCKLLIKGDNAVKAKCYADAERLFNSAINRFENTLKIKPNSVGAPDGLNKVKIRLTYMYKSLSKERDTMTLLAAMTGSIHMQQIACASMNTLHDDVIITTLTRHLFHADDAVRPAIHDTLNKVQQNIRTDERKKSKVDVKRLRVDMSRLKSDLPVISLSEHNSRSSSPTDARSAKGAESTSEVSSRPRRRGFSLRIPFFRDGNGCDEA